MRMLVRWAPLVLASGALAVFLFAPAVNGPALVLVWTTVLAVFRLVARCCPDPRARAAIGAGVLIVCFAGAFWGGWFLIPAVLAYILRDLRSNDPPDAGTRLPGLEATAAIVGAVAGWLVLAAVTANRLEAASRVTVVDGPEGPTVIEGTIADIAAAGASSDRAATVIAMTGLLLGAMLIAAVIHETTGARWSYLLLTATVVVLTAIALLGAFSIGPLLIPAIACGAASLAVGGRRHRPRGRGRPVAEPLLR
jgi:hypothetical protein